VAAGCRNRVVLAGATAYIDRPCSHELVRDNPHAPAATPTAKEAAVRPGVARSITAGCEDRRGRRQVDATRRSKEQRPTTATARSAAETKGVGAAGQSVPGSNTRSTAAP
jgi:hypothetical protein